MATFALNRMGRAAGRRRAKQLTRYQRLARAICFEPMESRLLMSATYAASPIAGFLGGGYSPNGRLVMDQSGNIYGTTEGGPSSDGSVFELSASTHQLTTLASFNGGNGEDPVGGLAIGADGTLYGTTVGGGVFGGGTVFKVAPNSNTITTLVTFDGLDESSPMGVIVGQDGNLYGVTSSDEDLLLLSQTTVFKVVPSTGSLTTVAVFPGTFLGEGGPDGGMPNCTLAMDAHGDLFGSTTRGGADGEGTIFEVAANSSTIRVLGSFSALSNPVGSTVVDSSGNVYVMTTYNGPSNTTGGAVFEWVAATNTIALVTNLGDTSGYYPDSGLAIDSSGNLYGATTTGGANGDGTLFEIASGSNTATPLISLDAGTGSTSDTTPLLGANGSIYITSRTGGIFNNGVLTEVTPVITATRAVMTSQPNTAAAVIAGAPQSFTVELQDANGNLDTSNDSTVTLALSDGNAENETLRGTLTATAVDGVATFDNVVFQTAGQNEQLTASVSGLASGNSSSINITAGAATHLVFDAASHTSGDGSSSEVPTQQAIAGQNFPELTASYEDQYGNVVTTDTSPVTITAVTEDDSSLGSGLENLVSLGGTSTQPAVNGVATFGDLSSDAVHLLTLRVSGIGVPSSNAIDMNVAPAAASQLIVISQPVDITAGVAESAIEIVAIDPFGNQASSYSATITASDGGTGLLGTVTEPLVAGEATFEGLSEDLAGTYTLQFSDGSLPNATATPFNVTPAAASQLAITAQPADITAGQTEPAVTVAVEDQFGNIVTDDGSGVTVSDGTSTGPRGTTTQTAIEGVATFDDLSETAVGNYTLQFADDGPTSANATPFNVTPAAASQLVVTTQPTDVVAGQTEPAITVAVEDQFGNLVTSDTSNVTVSDGGDFGALSSTTQTAVAGVATFANLSQTVASNLTMQFSDGSLTAATSTPFSVIPAAASQLLVTAQPTDIVAGGTEPAVTVAVLDQYGNLVTTDSSSVSVSDGAGALFGTTTRATDLGTATFNDLTETIAGNYSLQFSDGSLTAATSSAFNVTPGSVSHIGLKTVLQAPTDVFGNNIRTLQAIAGQDFPALKAYYLDTYGNVVTADTGAITLSAGEDTGSGLENLVALGGTTTEPAVNGTATFSDLSVDTAQVLGLQASSGLLRSHEVQVNVGAAAASQLSITDQPTDIAAGQTEPAVAVAVEDQYGNLVTTDTSDVTVSDGANGPVGTTTQAAVAGVATFDDLSETAVGSYTLQFSDGSLTAATSTSFDVTPGVAAKLVIDDQPTTAVAGHTLGELTVEVRDAFGNTVVNDTTVITVSPSAASLGGTAVENVAGGFAHFSDLSIPDAGTYTLTASDGLLTPAVTTPITIAPARTAPTRTIVAGTSIKTSATTLVAQLPDASPTIARKVKVQLINSGGTTVMSKFLWLASGKLLGGGLKAHTAGNYTLKVTDAQGQTVSTVVAVTPSAAVGLKFAATPHFVNGSASILVDVVDRFGNVVTSAGGEIIELYLGPYPELGDAPKLAGTLTATIDHGTATFGHVTLNQKGRGRIHAEAQGLGTVPSDIFTSV